MDTQKIVLCLIILGFIAALLYVNSSTEKYTDILMAVPTSPVVDYIEGGPDYHMVNAEGIEIIPQGDISLSPDYGVGEGTFGFGRFGASFMA